MKDPITLSEERHGKVVVVAVRGRIDTLTATTLTAALDGHFKRNGARVLVDLREVTYISSAGFRALLVASRKAAEAGGVFGLCNVIGEVCRLFEIAALTDFFKTYREQSDALSAMNAQ